MSETAIKIEHLTKIYKIFDKPTDRVKEALNPFGKRYSRDFYALNDLNLEIKKGETVGIIGKNGAGKSTLLKIITGVLTPTSGTLQVNGKIASLLELGAGFHPEMTGIENIYLNGTVMGYTKEEMDGRLQEIVDFADIGDFINQPVKMYSSGMFARLAFAVNAFVDPDILIVDEALSVGDIGFQSKCYRKFRELRENGVTILLVTHDLGAVLQFCNKAIFLVNGSKYGEGDAKTVVDLFKKFLADNAKGIATSKENVTDVENRSCNTKATAEVWKDQYTKNESMLEYGDKLLEFVDYKITNQENEMTTVLKNYEDVKISVKIRANKTVENPIVAFSIKDIKGTELVGSNTFIKDFDLGIMQEGQTYVVSFEQKLPLRIGKYTLSLGCTKYVTDDLHVFHRLYDVILLDIVSNVDTCGIVHVNPLIEVKKA